MRTKSKKLKMTLKVLESKKYRPEFKIHVEIGRPKSSTKTQISDLYIIDILGNAHCVFLVKCLCSLKELHWPVHGGN